MERLCSEADAALAAGVNILILSDRAAGQERAPVPALLATAGVHHHLVRRGTRLQCGLIVESGEPREVHHFCTLIGYGASAINPYLAFETLQGMIDERRLPGIEDLQTAQHNLIKAAGKGILKTISKMGISTVRSYCGAQIFEAVGLEDNFVEQYFTGTTSRIGGIGLDVLAVETLRRHRKAYPEIRTSARVPVGGYHQWRRGGEHHMWNPDVVATLQHATRHGGQNAYEEYSAMVNEEAAPQATRRRLLDFNSADEPIPLEEVEPAKEIVKRFATGAM